MIFWVTYALVVKEYSLTEEVPVERVDAALFFDMYGELLTAHQQEIWQLYYLEDWSLAEISQAKKISRAAVHDLLERSERSLAEYELKLRLVESFRRRRTILARLKGALQQAPTTGRWHQEAMQALEQLAEEDVGNV